MSPESKMSQADQTTYSGEVTDIFAHRLVIKTATGKILADLGPKGAELVALREGDHIEVSGEMKPSEMKVGRIVMQGRQPIDIERRKKPQEVGHDSDADPKIAIRAAREAGFTVLGEPKRRPKHFEILGRKVEGGFAELHIELDGRMRHAKPVGSHDRKWASEMSAAG
jgi:hypothetical protein